MRLVIGIKRDDNTTNHLQECGKEIPAALIITEKTQD